MTRPAIFLLILASVAISEPQGHVSNALLGLIRKIDSEQSFQTLFVFKECGESDCIDDFVLKGLAVPVVLFAETSDECNLDESDINSEMLFVYCMRGIIKRHLLDDFLKCLGRRRSNRIVFYWKDATMKETQLRLLLEYCSQNYLPNVIVIEGNFMLVQQFYSYTNFPYFQIESKHLTLETCFPNRLRNLKGAPVRTVPAANEPSSIVYKDSEDRVRFGGIAVKIVQAFADKYNATLVYPLPLKPYGYLDLKAMVENGTLDIPMSISSPMRFKHMYNFSCVVEQAALRAMLPIQAPIPVRDFFIFILNLKMISIIMALWIILSLLLTADSRFSGPPQQRRRTLQSNFCRTLTATITGIVGLAMYFPLANSFLKKFIYMLLFVVGLFVNTIFIVHLQTYLTSSPRSEQIMTFQQLNLSPIKVRLSPTESITLPQHVGVLTFERHRDKFVVSSAAIGQRKVLVPQYAYSVVSSLWSVIRQQQLRFPRPLFHVSEQMYFIKALYLCVPLHKHSIYRVAVDRLILQLHQTGLLYHWTNMAYQDMVAANLIVDPHVEPLPLLHILSVSDFYWIWWLYGAGMTLAILHFIVERLSTSIQNRKIRQLLVL